MLIAPRENIVTMGHVPIVVMVNLAPPVLQTIPIGIRVIVIDHVLQVIVNALRGNIVTLLPKLAGPVQLMEVPHVVPAVPHTHIGLVVPVNHVYLIATVPRGGVVAVIRDVYSEQMVNLAPPVPQTIAIGIRVVAIDHVLQAIANALRGNIVTLLPMPVGPVQLMEVPHVVPAVTLRLTGMVVPVRDV